jgi:hypothetical protein
MNFFNQQNSRRFDIERLMNLTMDEEPINNDAIYDIEEALEDITKEFDLKC